MTAWEDPNEFEAKIWNKIREEASSGIYANEQTADGLTHQQCFYTYPSQRSFIGEKAKFRHLEKPPHVEPANQTAAINWRYCGKGLMSHDQWLQFVADGYVGPMAALYGIGADIHSFGDPPASPQEKGLLGRIDVALYHISRIIDFCDNELSFGPHETATELREFAMSAADTLVNGEEGAEDMFDDYDEEVSGTSSCSRCSVDGCTCSDFINDASLLTVSTPVLLRARSNKPIPETPEHLQGMNWNECFVHSNEANESTNRFSFSPPPVLRERIIAMHPLGSMRNPVVIDDYEGDDPESQICSVGTARNPIVIIDDEETDKTVIINAQSQHCGECGLKYIRCACLLSQDTEVMGDDDL